MKKILFGIFIGIFSISAQFATGADWTYIKGTVLDENSSPLVGATVIRNVIDGAGTYTDTDGKFSLKVMPSDSITVDYLGYESQNISLPDVQDLKNIEIQMNPNAKEVENISATTILGALWEVCTNNNGVLTCEATDCVEPRYKLDGTKCKEQTCGTRRYTGTWVPEGTIDGGRYLVGALVFEQDDTLIEATTTEQTITRNKHKCVLNCPSDFHQEGNKCVPDNTLSQIIARLDELTSELKINKWRNADGTFNKARLASDLTAGVVLGTAGALITSNLVKKSQLESGFEDIKCTISGQTVAEFGDAFTVGVK